MGYFVKDKQIANITEPQKITLSANPNYIIFERNDDQQDTPVEVKIKINGTLPSPYDEKMTKITFSEKLAVANHELAGTSKQEEVDTLTFYIGEIERDEDGNPISYTPETKEVIAENLKNCLMSNNYFRNNFYISIPPVIADGSNEIQNGDTIQITSKGSGEQFAFDIKTEEDSTFYSVDEGTGTSNSDSIDAGKGDCEIQLDVYGNTGVLLGKDNFPDNDSMGIFKTDVSKKYFGQPLWFDINTLSDSRNKYSDEFLGKRGWADAGTASDFRYIARLKKGVNLETFYYSDVFYSITGYKRNLEENNLADYVYDTIRNKKIKPLTNQPTLTHVKGQAQYFNFILSDPGHDIELQQTSDHQLGIIFKLYTPSGVLIDTVKKYRQNHNFFNIVNTIDLEIDYLTRRYQNVGSLKACLCHEDEIVSEPLEFTILPDCLYDVHDFAFLNSLGGWSSFNFPSTKQTNFKTETNTYHSTQTPRSTISSRLEGIQSKEVEEQFTAKSMPVDIENSEWLKEMSASPAVYEIATKRYIVVDEFTLKYNSDEALYQYEMKYHYSDSYNAR